MTFRNQRILAGIIVLALAASIPGADAMPLFQSARHFDHGGFGQPNTILLDDATGDGRRDIILPHFYFDGHGAGIPLVATFPGLGDGTVGEPVSTFSTIGGGKTWETVIVSLNGDQHADLLLIVKLDSENFGRVLALLGNGDGSYTMSDDLYIGHPSQHIAAADFTGDGIIDFAVTVHGKSGPWSVHHYQGVGNGTFTEFGTTGLAQRTDLISAGDIDDDGDTDLVVSYWFEPLITLLVNDGGGQFTTQDYAIPGWTPDIEISDLDGDGLGDVAAVAYESGIVGILFGNPDGTLSEYVPVDTGKSTWDIELGDLDNDGDLDLTANTQMDGYNMQDRFAVLLNDGSGDFSGPEYSFGYASDTALGDMNGDGALDAVMNDKNACTSVLIGTGSGDFVTMTELLTDQAVYDISCTDVDLDGDPDIVAANADWDVLAMQVMRNNGDGTYADPDSYGNGTQPLCSDTGDLDGDGYPELFYTNDDTHSLEIWGNDGDGTFQFNQSISLDHNPSGVRAGDLDGDGDLDITVLYEIQLGVLINPGDGVFTAVTDYPAISHLVDLDLGDVDGDGDLDAVITGKHATDDGIYLMRNDGQGAFSAPEVQYHIEIPSAPVLADLDGDGDLDIAVTRYYENDILIMLNDGTGHFTLHPDGNPEVDLANEVQAGDLNGDGLLDLVAGTYLDLTFLPGLGDATFGPAERYAADDIENLALADCDGNGSLDAVVSGYYNVSVSVFFSSLSSSGFLATGPGRGEFNPTLVRVFPAGGSGDPIAQWPAYGVDRWGVNVALGQLDGVTGPEVLTGAGPGAVFGPHVRGFEIDGTPLSGVSFLAYGTNKYGVNATCGDLDSDGYDEIVTGAGPGAVFGPHVRGWNWDGAGVPTPIPGISYFAYGTPKWGVNVSCGDIDGDGFDEIVTGAGPGAVYGPHVRGWNCDGGAAVAIPGVSFLAYGTNKYGVNVTCGDIDGDGIDEMVTGAGPGAVFGPHVRAWNWDGSGTTQAIPAVSFFAYQYPSWGVNVSCGDLDDDGIDEILTGPGPGPDYLARVRGFNYDGQSLTALGGVNFIAYEGAGNRYGVKVAGHRQ